MYQLLAAICFILFAGTYGKPVEKETALASEDYPRYAFHYAVKDPYTKDSKAQWEERDGDIVKGAYSLREADGSLRVVEYSASDGQGFNAIVKNVGPNLHPVKINRPIKGALALPAVPALPELPALPALPAVPLPIIDPVIPPLTYGLSPAPLPLDIPKTTILGESSLPWDPLTGSYGGWVPLPSGPHAFIISKKVIDGHLHKLIVGPISLVGQKLIIRTTKKN